MKPNESPVEGAPEAASPFPPAFGWEASAVEPTTQVQATAVVPSYQQYPREAGDLFQPVATPHHEPAGTLDDSSAPPWTGSGLPPITEQSIAGQPTTSGQSVAEQPRAQQPCAQLPLAQQQSAWLRQGAEAFPAPATRASSMQPRSKQIVGLVVLGVILLGLVGATVAYVLTARSPAQTDLGQLGASQQAAPPRDLPSPPPPLPAPVDTTSALIDPPGQTRGGGGPFTLPQLLGESANLLQPFSIVSALQAGGMTDGVLKTTTIGSTTIGMFALTMPDQQAATTVAQAIATAQFDGGLKADDNRSLKGMTVMGSVPGSQTTAYRAVYVLYNRTIYVEVFGSSRESVLTNFDVLIKEQVTHAPPTVQPTR